MTTPVASATRPRRRLPFGENAVWILIVAFIAGTAVLAACSYGAGAAMAMVTA